MPELPEIEHLKRTLEPALIGAEVLGVRLRRPGIVRGREKLRGKIAPVSLLAGSRIVSLVRHGKNLAIVAASGRALGVHLGMSGQMCFVPESRRLAKANHVHCLWRIRQRGVEGTLIFRDPRRFGGLWLFDSLESLRAARFEPLGSDALSITTKQLRDGLCDSRRSIKAALLDQTVLAGVGNIYADESLFRAKIHPASLACNIPHDRITALASAIRAVLRRSIRAGGSTISDYIDGNGHAGGFAPLFQVYGRAGEPCNRCGERLAQTTIAQRTTVFCKSCQTRHR